MEQVYLDQYIEKLRMLGCEIKNSCCPNNNIEYHIIMPDRSLSESELEEIFSLILDSLHYFTITSKRLENDLSPRHIK